MKRPAPWQARRIATQKALRALPKCEYAGCEKRGMGSIPIRVRAGDRFMVTSLWVCPMHAQRAQREKSHA